MTKTYVVTGGAGFIGSAIARKLVARGDRVIVLDNLSTGSEANIPPEAEFIKIDLGVESSYDRLDSIRCDALLHLAGQSSGEASFVDPRYDFHSHVTSTFCLLDWCRKNDVRRFLYASSMSVYGDPDSQPVTERQELRPKTYYAAGKSAAEAYIKLHRSLGMDTTVFRMFSVYGPGQNLQNMMQGMVSIFLSYMLNGEEITVKGSKSRFRDFVFVEDVTDAWVKAIDSPNCYGKTYNLASGRATTVEQLIDSLKEAFGDMNYPVHYSGTTPGDQFGLYADVSLLAADLGWQPTTHLVEGLKRMIAHARK